MTRMACTVGLVSVVAGSASAAVTITLGASAPAYTDRSITFDEPGTPTGIVSKNTWLASHNIVIDAGDQQPVVDALQPLYGPWAGTGNAFFGNFGIFMDFAVEGSSLSMRVWDPSGTPGPFGGGAVVVVERNGVELALHSFTPAWGGIGNEWLNITTGPGESFDRVAILGFGFGPTTLGDDITWDVVPAPSGAAILGVAGLRAARRRRH